jgi:hypothetical protein
MMTGTYSMRHSWRTPDASYVDTVDQASDKSSSWGITVEKNSSISSGHATPQSNGLGLKKTLKTTKAHLKLVGSLQTE